MTARRSRLLSIGLVFWMVASVLVPVQWGATPRANAAPAAATFVLEGTVDCSQGCSQLIEGRWILRIYTKSIGGETRLVEVDVTDVLRDLPKIEQGTALRLEVDRQPDAAGRYHAQDVEDDEDGTFNPGTDRPEQPKPKQEDDEPPTFFQNQGGVTLSLSPVVFAENGGTATLTATVSPVVGQAVSVNLQYTGTAINGTDYTGAAVIVIPANASSASITLTGIDDAISEGNESVIVDIASVVNATENGNQQVTGTITDDEAAATVTLSVAPTSFAENQGTATLTATLSTLVASPVTVNLAYSGTATNGTDYTGAAVINIPANTISGSITLTGIDDALVDPAETVIVDITTVVNATENGVQQVTATINDDDATAQDLSITKSSVDCYANTDPQLIADCNDPDGTPTDPNNIAHDVRFLITVSNPAGQAVTNTVVTDLLAPADFTYVLDNSATTGTTYVPATGQWTIPSLAAGASITLRLDVDLPGTFNANRTNTASINVTPTNNDPDLTDNSASDDVEPNVGP